MRPTGPRRPWAVAVALAVTLTLIARTTGSGWAMVIVSGMLATFAVAAVWPALSLRRARLGIAGPRDATAGSAAEFHVSVTGTRLPLKLMLLDPPGEWAAADPGASGPVVVMPERRGVVLEAEVEVRSAAPLGLIWWRRVDRVALPAATEVGPRPIETPLPPVTQGDVGDTRPPRRRWGSEGVRSIRDYVAGDAARLVHWGATARRGELMVKELEDPEGAALALVVDLRGDPEAAEHAASRAAGMANEALRRRLQVVLLTAEAGGPRVAPVKSAVEVGRRLARAVAAAPPDGPYPHGAMAVRVSASDAAVVGGAR